MRGKMVWKAIFEILKPILMGGGAAVGWFLVNSTQALENIAALPDAFDKVAERFAYHSNEWTGDWAGDTEYQLDTTKLNISSDSDYVFRISAAKGSISGTLTSKRLCESNPLSDIEVFGETSLLGNQTWSLRVMQQGSYVEIAKLHVKFADEGRNVIDLEPTYDPAGMFPTPLRLIKQVQSEKTEELERWCVSNRFMFLKNHLHKP